MKKRLWSGSHTLFFLKLAGNITFLAQKEAILIYKKTEHVNHSKVAFSKTKLALISKIHTTDLRILTSLSLRDSARHFEMYF